MFLIPFACDSRGSNSDARSSTNAIWDEKSDAIHHYSLNALCVIKLSCFFLLISQVQWKCCHKNKCLSLKEVSHLKHIHLVFTGQFQFSSNVIYILHDQDYWHPITKQYETQSVFGISATYLLRACRKHWESYFWEKNSSYRNCVKTPFFHDVASY